MWIIRKKPPKAPQSLLGGPMLISFTFENFRSFLGKSTLSLEAHAAHKEISGALIQLPETASRTTHLLAAAAIYGANAAGKTNVIEAFDYVRDAVLNSQTRWDPSGSTRAQPHFLALAQPGTFEFECILDGVRFRYGFTATRDRFEAEWLYSYPHKRERLLFERRHGEEIEIKFGNALTGDEREHRSAKRRTRHNSLFLSAAAQENQKECLAIYDWMSKRVNTLTLPIDEDDYGFTNRVCALELTVKNQVLSILKGADSGISDLVIRKQGNKPVIKDEWATNISDELKEFVSENRDYTVEFVYERDGRRFGIPIFLQSQGTRRLYGLSSIVACVLLYGEVLMIDELESSLHPHISSQIVALFQSQSTNPNGAQLIFTTHDSNLLSADLLRRDQIWFVEKENGSSSLYSLLEFSPRKDESFEANYLRGRYGAVPQDGVGIGFLARGGENK